MRHPGFPPPHVLPCLLLLTACSGGGEGNRLVVGDEPDSSDGRPAGDGGRSGPPGSVDGSTRQGLEVHVEDAEALRVEIVTVACPGDCVAVEAVARGGFPPYHYRWSDGVTDAARTVCPEATASFTVLAEDAGFHTPEFSLPPATATAEVTARVLACDLPPDGGTPRDAGGTPRDAGGVDGGSCEPIDSSFCSSLLAGNELEWTAPFDETGFGGGGRLFEVHLDTSATNDQIFTVYQDATKCGSGTTATEFTLPAGATITQPLCLRPLGGLTSTSWFTLVARPADPFALSQDRGFGGSIEACGSCP